VNLPDAALLCHANRNDAPQEAVWKTLVENTLGPPDIWEAASSAGKDKRENFNQLLPHPPEVDAKRRSGYSTAPFFI
jgi:hypothetical protein